MNFLHYDFQLNSRDVVEVALDGQANVRLLDDNNYAKYKRGDRHTYFGELAKKSRVLLSPPHSGHWNLVIDLGGYAGRINASVRIIKG